jgi:predicted metal-dependent hydrolase
VPCRMVISPNAKYLRLQISSLKGLELIVPRGVNKNSILKFIKDHQDWISKKIRIPEDDFLFLGDKVTIMTHHIPESKYYEFTFKDNVLTITGHFSAKTNIPSLYEGWLYLRGRNVLVEQTQKISRQHGFRPGKIGVRRQTSRWGSCSGKGNISLNYKLLKYPQNIIDYVIIHELCHLTEMNHSKKFWDLVAKYVPDYQVLRKKLKSP